MKKLIIVSAVLLGAAVATQAGVQVSIGFSWPAGQVAVWAPAPRPVVVAPAPVYVPPPVCVPPPVVAAPPVCGPRVVYAPPPVVYAPARPCGPVQVYPAPRPYYGWGRSHAWRHGYGHCR